LFPNFRYAILVALIFAMHPMQVETIAWVSAKNNIIYTTFYVLAAIAYIRYSREGKLKFAVISFVLFVVACLSKPSAIAFPLCLFAIDYLLQIPVSKKSILQKVPFFAVALLMGFITLYTRTEDKFITSDIDIPIYERIGYAGYCMAFYIVKFLFPVNLSLVYPYPDNKIVWIVLGYLVWVLLAILIIRLYKKKQLVILGALGFILANFLLVIQLIPFGEVITADRYMYLPLIGFGFLLISIFKFSDKHINFIVFATLIYFSSLSFMRTLNWKNSITIFSDTVKKQPTSFLVLNSLGSEYNTIGKPNDGITYLNRAIAVAPNYYKAYYNRGLSYMQLQQFKNALNDLDKSISLHRRGDHYKSYVARGNVYYQLKDMPKAIEDAKTALVIDPENVKAQFLLANCYDDLNLLDQALPYYNNAIQLDSKNPMYYLRRAIVYGKMQQFSSCLQDLEACTNLDANYAEAYYWKGVVKVNMKQNPCADLRKAVDLGFMAAQQPLKTYCR
jgi:tetratricopeptide (TPR) repeat protein